MYPISFGSDNHSGVHPKIWDAMRKADAGYCPAYGDDPLTQKVLKQLEWLFGGGCEASFVLTGTGANVIALQNYVRSYHAVFCANTAHINVDECGAVQKFTQARLKVIDSPDGKLTPELIYPNLLNNRDQHHSQGRVVSITQSTEYGTLYSLAELKALADFSHEHGMYLHLDGARLANAAAALNCSIKEMTKDVGADTVSLGGAKNGLLFGEAMLSFTPELTSDLRFYRKQASQLFSKMRYIAAQFEAYLEGELWRVNALHANQMAALLASKLKEVPQVRITQPVTVNSLYVVLPREITPALQEKYHFYMWNEAQNEVRLMCSFNTTEDHIREFVADLKARL
ncbi:MAG TPA: beta-eliminating lyase-related protein [Candidatus Syntrophosphaera sp.]|nr:beta-eliminating lyase-related protein [Candidatus Syntrophosphaera sp.]HPH60818.1 beta-eliminating lyase-related protein [Candidatus Syntrophosphaera sp.]